MEFNLDVCLEGQWQPGATLTIESNRERLDYDFNLATQHADSNGLAALSLNLPVQLMIEHEHPTGFTVFDDFLPGGAAANYWLQHLGLTRASAQAQRNGLLGVAISPIGNWRVNNDLISAPSDPTPRFSLEEVAQRHSGFLEYAAERGAVLAGGTGAGGEAPKVLLRKSPGGQYWIDPNQDMSEADSWWLVKFPRGQRQAIDQDILRAEHIFYRWLNESGFDAVAGSELVESEFGPSLWMPRFDRSAGQSLGVESIYSIMQRPPGSLLNHETCIEALSKHLDPTIFVRQWLTRDLLNLAFGNSDNHGRNTAILKQPSGLKLAPIYDFAPMRADPEGIIRMTTWSTQFMAQGLPDWPAIVDRLKGYADSEALFQSLVDTADKVWNLREQLGDMGLPDSILNHPGVGLSTLNARLEKMELR